MEKLLILGDTGKVGTALRQAFQTDFQVAGFSRTKGFAAEDRQAVSDLLKEHKPAIVANAVALLGIETCEQFPENAFHLNAMLPRHLARLSRTLGFQLLHFSTDAVFDDSKGDSPRLESDPPRPMNLYGMTKFAGDCFVQAEAEDAYVFRLSVLLGPSVRADQFVERMIRKVREGASRLRIAGDVLCSPSYSLDVAARIRQIVREDQPRGLYHVAHSGRASLYELMDLVRHELDLPVVLEKASHTDFPCTAPRSITTFLGTEKQEPMRPWMEAVRDYCAALAGTQIP